MLETAGWFYYVLLYLHYPFLRAFDPSKSSHPSHNGLKKQNQAAHHPVNSRRSHSLGANREVNMGVTKSGCIEWEA